MRIIVTGPDDLDTKRHNETYHMVRDTLELVTLKLDLTQTMLLTHKVGGLASHVHHWCFRKFVAYQIFHHWKDEKKQKKLMQEMFDKADAFLAFWDLEDEETELMIDMAKMQGIKRRKVVLF